jgi:membrane protease YdiL (CAAX protease family)
MTLPDELPDQPPPAPVAPRMRLNARRALFILLAFVGAQLVGGVIVTLVYMASDQAGDMQRATILPATIVGTLLGIVVVARMNRRSFSDRPWREALRAVGVTPTPRRDLAASAALGAVLSVVYVLILTRVAPPDPERTWGPVVQAVSAGGPQRLLWVVLAVAIAPPVEEFVFRGVLFQGLANSWGRAKSAVIVTGIFALFHVPETGSYWPAILAITIMAVLVMAIRLRYGSLGPAIAMHMAYNAVLAISAFGS